MPGGETEEKPSGWTTDTLHAHMQAEFNSMRRLLDERATSQLRAVDSAKETQQEALRTALASMEKRLDAMNEFRAQLRDQTGTYMPRTESLAIHEATNAKVDTLNARLADLELRVTSRLEIAAGGQQATQRLIAWGIGSAGLVITIVVFVANYIFK